MNFDAEVKEKWGKTAAYSEYEKKNLSEADYKSATDGLNFIFAEFAKAKNAGNAAESDTAQKLVLKLKNYISENFYTCDDKILAGLGKMYIEDIRFKNNIDKNGAGTAQYASDVIAAYCRES